jgi:FemAB-related protein (PEP-CTERM system-associated)
MYHGVTSITRTSVRIVHSQPQADGTWCNVLKHIEHANLAQLPQWYNIIQQAYGHIPIYLEGEDNIGHHAILPSFLIRNPMFGAVVTSMPFLDAGGPCSASPALTQTLLASLLGRAAEHGARLVEVRCTAPMDLPLSPVGDKVNLCLQLPKTPELLWRQLDTKIRNQIRKAERSALSIEVGHAEKLNDFYELFLHNMRDLGSPVHALGFFQTILTAFGDNAQVVLVRKGAKAIGGLIALTFKDSLIVPWASSLRRYLPLCPNMLLYWETLRLGCLQGVRRFEFGRSSRNSGTYRFKRQWGALEEPLYWYTIPLNPHRVKPISITSKRATLLMSVWQHLPLNVTRWLGPKIRKYLPQ